MSKFFRIGSALDGSHRRWETADTKLHEVNYYSQYGAQTGNPQGEVAYMRERAGPGSGPETVSRWMVPGSYNDAS
jgi:hypothetical protein